METKKIPRSLGILTAEDVVSRARSAVGVGTVYRLGGGGRDPRAATPGPKCDCSGFVAWALGVDRYLPNGLVPHMIGGEWFETSSVYADARSPFGYVAEVVWMSAIVGDIVVWPDRNGSQGHIGIVSEADAFGPTRVVHCSAGNYAARGDAIAETSAAMFHRKSAIAARVAWVVG